VLGSVPHVDTAALKHTLLLVPLALEHTQAQCRMRHNKHQMASQYLVKRCNGQQYFQLFKGLIDLGDQSNLASFFSNSVIGLTILEKSGINLR
jgi:hypothetical protein